MKRWLPFPGMRDLAVACLWMYPRAWRLRYASEMFDLLDQYPITWWTVVDVLLGAVDAHLHQQWLPQEVLSLAQQIRTSANALLVAFYLFFIAWIMVQFIGDTPAVWNVATAHHLEIRTALTCFIMAGAVAMVALLVGGIPVLTTIVAQAIQGQRRDLRWRLLLPIVLGILLVAFSLVAQPSWWSRRLGVTLPASAIGVKVSFFIVAFLTLGVSTWAIISAATRSALSDRLLRFIRLPGLVVGLALWSGFLALLTLTILVVREAPQLADPGFLLPIFAGVVLCACGIASTALKRLFVAAPLPQR